MVMFERKPDLVRGRMAVEPLVGGDLVGAQHGAHVVVEDLGGGAGQRCEARVLQPTQVGGQVFAQPLGTLGDLERGEPVHVHVGHRVLHGAGDVDVVVAVEVGVDAALQRHLGGAHLPRLGGALGDVVERQQVRRAAQVQRQRPLREAAELALERAHVGVVDVAVVHPRDGVADRLVAQFVGQLGDRRHLGAAGPEQRDDLRRSRPPGRRCTPASTSPTAPVRTRRAVAPAAARGGGCVAPEYHCVRAMADQHHLGAVLHHVGGGDLLRPDRAGVVAAQALRRRCGPSPRNRSAGCNQRCGSRTNSG